MTGMRQDQMTSPKLCESKHINHTSLLTRGVYSMAEQRFAAAAEKFLRDCLVQMGVHVFMMVGYKDQNGKMLRSKYVAILDKNWGPHTFLDRLESPKLHPDAKSFLPIFQEVGGETWKSFDQFLADCAGMLLVLSPLNSESLMAL